MFFLQRQKILFVAILLLGLTACSPNRSGLTPTTGPTPVLLTYQTSTPSETPANSGGVDVELPSPTPATYIVAEGDSFFTIAARLGIDLDALMAANPGVDPRLLTPGTELVLPPAGGAAVPSILTPTAVPMTVGETRCYASTAGELWCFLPVENTLPTAVENLTAVIQLLSASGEVLATLEATPPLNLLDAGDLMPLVAYSPDSPEEWTTARGQLLSAYTLAEGSDYYLAASIPEPSVDISEDGLFASVVGRVEIQNGTAAIIWVLAVAYDDQGNVIGVRRWESEGDTEFGFFVYSLGPEIATVDLLVEARP